MQGIINYLSEGWKGLTLSATGGIGSVMLNVFKEENLQLIISLLQIVLLTLSIIVAIVTIRYKLKNKK